MSDSDSFIAMGRDDDQIGDLDDDYAVPPSFFWLVLRSAVAAPALGLAALVIGTATLLSMSAVTNVQDIVVYGHRSVAYVSSIRWSAGFRLGIAIAAVMLAIAAGWRERLASYVDDDEPAPRATTPGWVQVVIGAALLVGLVSLIVNGIAFVDAMQAHAPTVFGFTNG